MFWKVIVTLLKDTSPIASFGVGMSGYDFMKNDNATPNVYECENITMKTFKGADGVLPEGLCCPSSLPGSRSPLRRGAGG